MNHLRHITNLNCLHGFRYFRLFFFIFWLIWNLTIKSPPLLFFFFNLMKSKASTSLLVALILGINWCESQISQLAEPQTITNYGHILLTLWKTSTRCMLSLDRLVPQRKKNDGVEPSMLSSCISQTGLPFHLPIKLFWQKGISSRWEEMLPDNFAYILFLTYWIKPLWPRMWLYLFRVKANSLWNQPSLHIHTLQHSSLLS